MVGTSSPAVVKMRPDLAKLEKEVQPEQVTEGTWSSWFHEYASRQPRALQRVSFVPHHTVNELDGDKIDPGYALVNDKYAGDADGETIEAMIFPYAEIDFDYISPFEDKDCNLYRALRGLDMGGWRELVAVMKQNCERRQIPG